ncbi:hypothetical protein ACOSP7_027489 [Xanthoceras sorbifolium]
MSDDDGGGSGGDDDDASLRKLVLGTSLKISSGSDGGGVAVGDHNGSLHKFILTDSTYLASFMPKKEIGADRFIDSHPEFEGRGILIAIFDSGVDPTAAGLQVTSNGKPKILDVLDGTSNGDIDTLTIVKTDSDGCIRSFRFGASLVVNSSWKNPSGEWHMGYKMVYELFTDSFTSRLKIIHVADEVIDWVDQYKLKLAMFNSQKSDPEDEEAEKIRKKLETTRDQLTEAIYQKGLAMVELESLKFLFSHILMILIYVIWQAKRPSVLAATESTEYVDKTGKRSAPKSGGQPYLFEDNFRQLRKWVNSKSSKYRTMLVIRARRNGRLGTALKVLNNMIQDDAGPPKKKLSSLPLL